jgi:hypothetical protein
VRSPNAVPAAGARNRMSRPSRSSMQGKCDCRSRARGTSWQAGSTATLSW